jgi:hypothetical protein
MEKEVKQRGRKPMAFEDRMQQRVVTFNEKTAFKLLRIGEGNMSLGIRRATEIAFAQKELDKELDD